ncbi:MAG: hypothetical protein WC180_07240, partial [Candidatus Paceibacterota bacterium]
MINKQKKVKKYILPSKTKQCQEFRIWGSEDSATKVSPEISFPVTLLSASIFWGNSVALSVSGTSDS